MNRKAAFDLEISKARTMAEILEICGRYYDLNEPLGIATKILVTGGLKKVIQIIKAKEK
jgi:hypothetical protein